MGFNPSTLGVDPAFKGHGRLCAPLKSQQFCNLPCGDPADCSTPARGSREDTTGKLQQAVV